MASSIDIKAGKEYTYTYNDGKLLRATESAIEIENDIVTVKTPLHSIEYTYNAEGELTRKQYVPRYGAPIEVGYDKSGDEQGEGNVVTRFTAGGRAVTSRSKSDGFGRKEYDELQLGCGYLYRRFTYHNGAIPQEHRDNGKVPIIPHIKQIVLLILLFIPTAPRFAKARRGVFVVGKNHQLCWWYHKALAMGSSAAAVAPLCKG